MPSGWSSDGRVTLVPAGAQIHRPAETSGLCPWWASPSRIRLCAPRPTSNTARSRLTDDGWRKSRNETGAYEVYVESFPATGFKRQISTQGSFEPAMAT